MTEFIINASVSETTKFVLFKLNKGYMPSMLREIRSDSMIPKGIKDFAAQALQNLAAAHNAIIVAHIFQTCNMNQGRSAGPDIQEGMLGVPFYEELDASQGESKEALL